MLNESHELKTKEKQQQKKDNNRAIPFFFI